MKPTLGEHKPGRLILAHVLKPKFQFIQKLIKTVFDAKRGRNKLNKLNKLLILYNE